MEKAFPDLTPQELNDCLINKYGYNLFYFCALFYEVVIWKRIYPNILDPPKLSKWYIPKAHEKFGPEHCLRISIHDYPDRHIMVSLKRKIINLENNAIDLCNDIDSCLDEEGELPRLNKSSPDLLKDIKGDYRLSSFFGYLDFSKYIIDGYLSQTKLGSPVNPRNLLSSVWALFIQKHGKTIDWEFNADLLDWAWAKLKQCSVYRAFKPKQDQIDADYLKNQFYKHSERWEKYYSALIPWVCSYPINKANGDTNIFVFGCDKNEIHSSSNYFLELVLRGVRTIWDGDIWKQAQQIYLSRTSSSRRRRFKEDFKNSHEAFKYASRANLNWLIIFPDNSFAIDPK